MENEFYIGNQKIGIDSPPFIIAEMSGNHNQSLERALSIVDSAVVAGANAIKLQTYTADTITLDISEGEFFIKDEKNLWKGKSLHQLYKQAFTPWEWHEAIFKHAKQKGILCFSSPFDETAVDFLQSLDVPCFKIASFENNHLPLIRKAAATGKPLIISTGMATLSELDEAVATAREAGCKNLVLLKCTSSYPSTPEHSNINTIPHLRKLFQCEVGLSDHTLGVGVAVASVGLGASVIEKHFTLSRADGGVDSVFSLEPKELASLVVESKNAWESLGNIQYGPSAQEVKSLIFRRSLYVAEDMVKGDIFTKKNLRIVRPGNGLAPKFFDVFLGKPVHIRVKKGTPVTWDLLIGESKK